MTATPCMSLTRHARRLGVGAAVVGALTMAGTSTLAFAEASRPTEAAAAASVVGLRQGDSGPTVQAVQQKLIDFGYYVADGANGTFGAGTTAALRVFQQQNGLNPTGVVTENTARYLGLAAGVPATGAATPQGLRRSRGDRGRCARFSGRASSGSNWRVRSPGAARHSRHRVGARRRCGRHVRSFDSPRGDAGPTCQRPAGDGSSGRGHGRRPRSVGERLLPVDPGSGRCRCPTRGERRLGAAHPTTADQGRDQRRRGRRRRVRPADQALRPRLPGPQRSPQTGTVDAATDAALAKVAGGRRRRTNSVDVVRRPARRFDRTRCHQTAAGDHGHRARRARRCRRHLRPAHAHRRGHLSAGQRAAPDRHRRRDDGSPPRPDVGHGDSGSSRLAAAPRRPASRATTSVAPAWSPCRRR